MKSVALRGRGVVEVVEVGEPALLDGSVIVEIDRCGIGGSDVMSFLAGTVPAPAWFGHEWSGRVVEVGPRGDRPEISERFVGERVVGSAPPACGRCRNCRAGFADLCEVVLEMIIGVDSRADQVGGFSERIRVDARRVTRIPEGIDQSDAALAEPASVAAHAVARSEMGLGDLVVVMGAGTIGLLVSELAQLAGASRVVVIDPDSQRRELACDLGADAAFPTSSQGDEGTASATTDWLSRAGHGLGADVVFDCAGSTGSLLECVQVARRGGTAVAVGVAAAGRAPGASIGEGQPLGLSNRVIIDRQITLRASQGYTVRDVRRVLAMMAEDRLRVLPIYDPEPVPLTRVGEVLDSLSSAAPTGWLKPLVQPTMRETI